MHYDFDFGDSRSIWIDEELPGMQNAIAPVMIRGEGHGPRVEGTSFCIALLENGEAVFATAAHVIEQLNGIGKIEGSLLLPKPLMDGKNRRGLAEVPINFVSLADTNSDVALLVVNRYMSGVPVLESNTMLEINLDEPLVGTECIALGYPQVLNQQGNLRILASRGPIECLHPRKRDTVLSTFPSFRTSGEYRSGMSGGPVIDSQGKVIGIVSHGIDPDSDGRAIGYAAIIGSLAEHAVELHTKKGSRQQFTFEDLVHMQVISAQGKNTLTIQRDVEGLQLTWES